MTIFSDFCDDPICVFDRTSGLSVNLEKDRIFVFERTGPRAAPWKLTNQLKLEDLRNMETVDGLKTKVFSGQASIRTIRDNINEDLRARDETGIKLQFSSMVTPEVFINVPDTKRRAVLVEGLRQIFDGAQPEMPVRDIPKTVEISFPSQELRHALTKKNTRRKRTIALALVSTIILLGVGWALTPVGHSYLFAERDPHWHCIWETGDTELRLNIDTTCRSLLTTVAELQQGGRITDTVASQKFLIAQSPMMPLIEYADGAIRVNIWSDDWEAALTSFRLPE